MSHILLGLKTQDITWSWIKLQNEKFRDLYSSPHIVTVIKSGMIRRTGHVACMGEIINENGIYFENLKSKDSSGNLDVVWRIILKWILNKQFA